MGLIWIVVLAAGGYIFYRWYTASREQGTESSLDILKRRYARGEITKAQFEEMKKVL